MRISPLQNVSTKADSVWQFVSSGAKQGGGMCLVLVMLLLVARFAGVLNGYYGGKLGFWMVGILSGPIAPVLVRFDISNKQLEVIWFSSIPFYWIFLGASVGFLRSKVSATQAGGEQVCLPGRVRNHILPHVALVALIIGALSTSMWPSFAGGGPSPQGSIINNLRQLDGAKQQLASENKRLPDYVPTQAELSPYLRNDFLKRPAGPIRYVLNPVNKPPYAVLDSDWRIRRRGWQEGFKITNGTVFRLP